MILGLTNTEFFTIVGLILWGIAHYTGRIDYQQLEESLLDKFYSNNFEALSIFVLIVGNQIVKYIYGFSFSSLDTNIQMLIVGFLLAFYLNTMFSWTEKVIYEILSPKFKAHLNLEPEHDGEFDVLIAEQDLMEDQFEIVGADELHEKPAGRDGKASVQISRGINWAENKAIATWRALKDPLEVEESESNIYYNSKAISDELDEARAYKREALIYKLEAEKRARESADKRLDEIQKMDDDDAYEDIMKEAHARYDPREDEETPEGVKEKFEEEDEEELQGLDDLQEQQQAQQNNSGED